MKINHSWKPRKIPHPDSLLLQRMIRRTVEICKLPIEPEHGINIVFASGRTMARINREFVGHQGVTDVITFNYLEGGDGLEPGDIAIELVICPEVAQREGKLREDSSYAHEMVLYIVHGLLHCSGHDDLEPATRSRMRKAEQRLMACLEKEFDFAEIFPC